MYTHSVWSWCHVWGAFKYDMNILLHVLYHLILVLRREHWLKLNIKDEKLQLAVRSHCQLKHWVLFPRIEPLAVYFLDQQQPGMTESGDSDNKEIYMSSCLFDQFWSNFSTLKCLQCYPPPGLSPGPTS